LHSLQACNIFLCVKEHLLKKGLSDETNTIHPVFCASFYFMHNYCLHIAVSAGAAQGRVVCRRYKVGKRSKIGVQSSWRRSVLALRSEKGKEVESGSFTEF
jgi:hypothetical protein